MLPRRKMLLRHDFPNRLSFRGDKIVFDRPETQVIIAQVDRGMNTELWVKEKTRFDWSGSTDETLTVVVDTERTRPYVDTLATQAFIREHGMRDIRGLEDYKEQFAAAYRANHMPDDPYPYGVRMRIQPASTGSLLSVEIVADRARMLSTDPDCTVATMESLATHWAQETATRMNLDIEPIDRYRAELRKLMSTMDAAVLNRVLMLYPGADVLLEYLLQKNKTPGDFTLTKSPVQLQQEMADHEPYFITYTGPKFVGFGLNPDNPAVVLGVLDRARASVYAGGDLEELQDNAFIDVIRLYQKYLQRQVPSSPPVSPFPTLL